jgi:hypothetical protein
MSVVSLRGEGKKRTQRRRTENQFMTAEVNRHEDIAAAERRRSGVLPAGSKLSDATTEHCRKKIRHCQRRRRHFSTSSSFSSWRLQCEEAGSQAENFRGSGVRHGGGISTAWLMDAQ